MEPLPSWKTFALELLLYALLLVVYFACVLHFLGGWFKDLYDHNRDLYATMALVIMISQTVVLEVASSFLVWVFRERRKKGRK